MNLLNGGVTEIRFSAMTTPFAHVALGTRQSNAQGIVAPDDLFPRHASYSTRGGNYQIFVSKRQDGDGFKPYRRCGNSCPLG